LQELDIGGNYTGNFSLRAIAIMSGRVLLGNQDVPVVSLLWPVVIERENSKRDWPIACEANAIFDLLRLLDTVHEPPKRKISHSRKLDKHARKKMQRSEALTYF
jgi:hypothetical protein